MSEAVLKLSELRISVAVGAAVLIQTALALVWSGSAAERLAQLERRSDATAELVVRAARLEEQILAMRKQLERIETKLDGEGKR
ncbi:MAG TPA: hypothetical protein PKM48_10085 [Parvularculaceae bacterium]|nr:hypothetical protein [Parvularculaceae bacterium]HNS86349.1 hypothetical protein [Parvularculaceae bacterium]